MKWNETGRIVVVAPHPDDEVLALGGTISALAHRGCEIVIVAVTDGEKSHPRSNLVSPEQMARKRAKERSTALARLGISSVKLIRLCFSDGALKAKAHSLIDPLADIIRGAAMCLAPWEEDGHPDHDATGRAAIVACVATEVPLAQYPIWAWHWANPYTSAVPWSCARRINLSPELREAKLHAIEAYQSQIAPLGPGEGNEAILPQNVLAHFRRPYEVVFV